MNPKRVLVLDANQQSRAAMTDRLRAAGYAVLQSEDPSSGPSGEMLPDFAVVHSAPEEIGATADEGELAGRAAPTLVIGRLMPAACSAAHSSGKDLEEAREHAVRIFSTIAPVFLDVDQDAAFRLATGLYALGSRIWGPCPPNVPPAGGSRPADEALD